MRASPAPTATSAPGRCWEQVGTGKRVLVLDGDPQGDTSKTFGVYEPDGIGMSELLEKHECVGGTYKTGDLIRPTEYSHVDIIPANGYLMKTDMNLL